MLNKFWNYEVLRKCFQKKTEPPHARLFCEPRCQVHVAGWYLLYRWLIFIAWLGIIICSLFEIGSYKPLYKWQKWAIYLTNWDLALGTIQAFLGALIVSKRWKLQKDVNFDPCNMKLTMLERSYWFCYTVTSSLAIAVTISYWTAVYNPKIHQIDPLNIMLHVCNSILMIIDIWITSIPFNIANVWWCLIVVIFYIIFSIIYYLAGGLDKLGYHYIYKILDWKKPGQTLLVCIGGITFVAIMHFIMCLLERFKNCLYTRIAKKVYKDTPVARVNYPVTKKEAEVV